MINIIIMITGKTINILFFIAPPKVAPIIYLYNYTLIIFLILLIIIGIVENL